MKLSAFILFVIVSMGMGSYLTWLKDFFGNGLGELLFIGTGILLLVLFFVWVAIHNKKVMRLNAEYLAREAEQQKEEQQTKSGCESHSN